MRESKKNYVRAEGEEGYFPFQFGYEGEVKGFSFEEVRRILLELVECGVIEGMNIEKRRYNSKKKVMEFAGSQHINKMFLTELESKGELLNFTWSKKPEDLSAFYKVKVNEGNLVHFIDYYLSAWAQGKLFNLGVNILLAEKQIEIAIESILSLLSSHSQYHLHVPWVEDRLRVDFFAVILFLSSYDYIELIDLSILQEKGKSFFSVIIDLKEKFFVSFNGDSRENTIKLNELINEQVSIPEYDSTKEVIIVFDELNRSLEINGANINISKSDHQFDLIKVVAQNPPINEDICFTEIADQLLCQLDDEAARQRYYQAVNSINKKIALKTGIKKLFKTKRQQFRFNPKLKIRMV